MENQTIEQLEIIIRAKVDDAIKGITTLTDAIKQKVAESTKPVQNLADKTREISSASNSATTSASTSFLKYKNTIKQATAQQELLLRRIQDLKGTLNDIDLSKMLGSNEKLEMQAELEKLINQYNLLGNDGDNASKKVKNSFEDLWKSIKKGTLTLLGVHSAFSLIQKGISSAVSVSEELQATQEVTNNALGQIFVPLMQKAYVVVQYLVIGLARLIEMFTGVNILSKVTTKNIDKTSKSVKGLSKQLSSIDDIDVLSSDKGSLAGGLSADLKALEEFQERIAKVDALFESWGIPKKIEAIKNAWNTYIQPILSWLWGHPEVLSTFFGVFLTGKLLKSINNVMGSANVGTGLLGMNQLLIGLAATTFTIDIVRKIKDEYDELHDSAIKGYHTGSMHWNNFLNQQDQAIDEAIADGSLKAGVITEDFKNTINEWGTDVTDNINSVFDLINTNLDSLNVNMQGTKDTINNLLVGLFNPELHDDSFDKLAELADKTSIISDKIKLIVDNTELTDEQYKSIIDKLRIQGEHLEHNLNYFTEGSDEWNKTNDALDKTNKLIKYIKYDVLGLPKPIDKFKEKWTLLPNLINDASKVVSNTLQPAIDKVKNTDTAKAISCFSDGLKQAEDLINKQLEPVTKNWLNNFKESQKLNVDTTDAKNKIDTFTQYWSNNLMESKKLDVDTADAKYKVDKLGNQINGLDGSHTVDVKYNVDADTTKASSKLMQLLNSSLPPSLQKILNLKIPQFASGNVATSPTLGIFGEYSGAKSNPEVTAPQSVLKQTFTEVLATNNYNSNTEQRIIVQLGTKELFDEFIDYVNNKTSNGVQVFKED